MAGIDGLRDTLRTRRDPIRIDRRTLLIGGGAAAGLAVAWAAWPRADVAGINASADEAVLGNFLKVGNDGHVTVIVPQTETGQGIFTQIAQIVADELGADWRTIAVEPSPISALYANTLFMDVDAAQFTPRTAVPDALANMGRWRRSGLIGPPAMFTGGSTDMRMFEAPARDSAALARALLSMAAAARWDVAWEECETGAGFVKHGSKRLRFGELAAEAALLTPPDFPAYRPRDRESLYGQSLPRLDLPAKIDGSFGFAADIRLPGMAYAAIRQGPHGDTVLLRYNRRAADRVPGFLSAVRNDRWLAAVATNGWAAQRALDAMAPIFRTTGALANSADFDRRLARATSGTRIVTQGSTDEAFSGRRVIGADYHVAPALHATIETRSATAAPDGDRMRLWVASLAPGHCRAAVAAALGIASANVILFPMPAGGGLGAGYDHSVAVQAALIARAMQRPVQLSWSRTEEILRDMPRAPVRATMRATLSAGASIDGWHVQIATPPARHEFWRRIDGAKPDAAMRAAQGASDAAAVAGALPPYAIPHIGIDHLPVDTALPAGYGAGNADSYTCFFTEAFVDEMADAANIDALSFRMGMLSAAPRLALCLQNATSLGGWDGGTPGSGQGIACHALRGSHIAVMAVARQGERGLIVDRLVAVADCGRVVNPAIVKQHIESGLVLGLASAIGATSRYRRGLAQARRLGELNLPILAQMPAIVVDLIQSEADPGGTEEIALPLVAPAIANALFTVTGRRLRRLPLIDRPLPGA